jgi:AcrR family transcriptional regulator
MLRSWYPLAAEVLFGRVSGESLPTAGTSRPRGRRPGRSTTRDDVLAAAREAFSELGFEKATIRDIAARAGVDPALVMQFFASKHGLFVAAMELPFDPAAVVAAVLDGPESDLGVRMVATFLRMWDDPDSGPRMVGLLRAAATQEAAAARLRELIEDQILGPVADRLAGADARLRVQLVGSQLVGLGFARYVLRLEPLASAPADELCRRIGPTVQRYVSGPA